MEGNKIVKITSAAQFAKLVELMEEKPYIAKGINKINIKEEWNDIADKLNCIGTPTRTGEGCMKVWADFKFKLKKKLAHNKAENQATGGRGFKKFILSAAEEAAVSLLDMPTVIAHNDPFGLKRPQSTSQGPEPNLDTTFISCTLAESSSSEDE